MEIKRTLAEIVTITEKEPIPNADKIEVVKIRGWEVVVQKGIYDIGDVAVYFSIDALLPERPEFEWLRDRCFVSKSQEGAGFRVKTIKLRGVVSQGLLMPLSEITFPIDFVPEDGADVTDVLEIRKYEKILPANLAGVARGNFPTFIPKTDEPRIQNYFGKFVKNQDHEWEVSLKLDGSSMTAYYFAEENRFGVCSRNLDLKETEENSFWQVARALDIETRLRAYHWDTGISLALQGECVGPGIQKNRENLPALDLYVFNIWNITEQRYLDAYEREEALDILGIKSIEIYEITRFGDMTVAKFLNLADTGYGGKSLNHSIREGLVFKSVVDPSISFKAISNRYLVKCEE